MAFTVEIPVPPSLNNAFFNNRRGGRVKTPAYKAWLDGAIILLRSIVKNGERVGGPFRISINLPSDMRGDIDNRVKGIVDALVKAGCVDDDRHMEELTVRRRHDGIWAKVYVKPDRPECAEVA